MFLFVVYAVVVWYFAVRYRRRWRGFASVALGVAGLVGLAYLHIRLSRWTGGRIYLQQLQVLLYPYTLLVGAIGLYACCLRRAVNPMLCPGCGYDRSGLARTNAVCPECGRVEYPLNGTRCASCGQDMSGSPRPAGECSKCGVGYRPAEPPPPMRLDPRRGRAVYPRRIRHASPHAKARSGRPPMTDQRQSDN